MKSLIKSILRGLGVLAVLIVLAGIIFFIRFRKATKAMIPSETSAINDSVWCIKDKYVNAYLFRGRDGYILFDAGLGSRNFAKELQKTGISPDQVKAILLTHADGDHIGAISLFRNAVVYMQKDEEQMVNGTMGKMKFYKPVWKYGTYKLLSANDSLNIYNLPVKLIHTPGHTPGSSCFIVSADYLVTGDNLLVEGDKFVHFTEMFNMDTPAQVESLKILPVPSAYKYILTGHHGVRKMQE